MLGRLENTDSVEAPVQNLTLCQLQKMSAWQGPYAQRRSQFVGHKSWPNWLIIG